LGKAFQHIRQMSLIYVFQLGLVAGFGHAES
jgi:hypothetical protein